MRHKQVVNGFVCMKGAYLLEVLRDDLAENQLIHWGETSYYLNLWPSHFFQGRIISWQPAFWKQATVSSLRVPVMSVQILNPHCFDPVTLLSTMTLKCHNQPVLTWEYIKRVSVITAGMNSYLLGLLFHCPSADISCSEEMEVLLVIKWQQ